MKIWPFVKNSKSSESNLGDSTYEVSPEVMHQVQEAVKGKVKKLDLSGRGLHWLPESVGGLEKLETLILSGNHLMALPESLGRLKELRELDVSNNQLATLPQSLGYL